MKQHGMRTRRFFNEDYSYIMDAKGRGNLGRYINVRREVGRREVGRREVGRGECGEKGGGEKGGGERGG